MACKAMLSLLCASSHSLCSPLILRGSAVSRPCSWSASHSASHEHAAVESRICRLSLSASSDFSSRFAVYVFYFVIVLSFSAAASLPQSRRPTSATASSPASRISRRDPRRYIQISRRSGWSLAAVPPIAQAYSQMHCVCLCSLWLQVYYDVAGKPYLTCGKCSAHVTIAKKDVGAAAGAGAAAAGSPRAPVHEGEGLGSPPAAGGAGGAAPGGAPSAAAPEGVYHGETVICPSCKNPIEGVQH